ncbi:hypothetical protein BDY21DRAFT_127516 [Lineolata rhizophorae]|uniref:Zn(2)-C6 fungal-type domain-containing protein n=1 Tax=Lineolata rhizophorae TaxID=578093 RepID=A0A6A6NPA6_9PEZI|nr:hypothetical protein BDY21DRAFT_127516 [Lineolata rhizophorae]
MYSSGMEYRHGSTLGMPPAVHPYLADRSIPLSMSQCERADVRASPMGRLGQSRGSMPPREPEAESPTGSGVSNHRRRVAVACGRCRRRKIRCSGDPGDGSGCTNCRQSGASLEQCLFHRVGTLDSHYFNCSNNVRIPSTPTTYLHSTGHGVAAPPTQTLNVSYTTPIRTFSGTYPGASPTMKAQHQQHWNGMPLPEEPSLDSYIVPMGSQDPYYQSGHDSGVHRTWSPAPSVSRPIYYEQEPPGTTYASQISWNNPPAPRQPTTSADTYSSLCMSSLTSSLPVQPSAMETRQLPVPNARRTNGAMQGSSAAPISGSGEVLTPRGVNAQPLLTQSSSFGNASYGSGNHGQNWGAENALGETAQVSIGSSHAPELAGSTASTGVSAPVRRESSASESVSSSLAGSYMPPAVVDSEEPSSTPVSLAAHRMPTAASTHGAPAVLATNTTRIHGITNPLADGAGGPNNGGLNTPSLSRQTSRESANATVDERPHSPLYTYAHSTQTVGSRPSSNATASDSVARINGDISNEAGRSGMAGGCAASGTADGTTAVSVNRRHAVHATPSPLRQPQPRQLAPLARKGSFQGRTSATLERRASMASLARAS